MAEIFRQAMVQEVYYPMGRFNHDFGKKRFVRAPFVLVKLQPTVDAAWQDYWMPTPFGGSPASGGDCVMKDFMGADGGDGECRHPFGYITRQDIMMEQSELGDCSAVSMGQPEADDTWKMFHRIGFI